MRECSITDCVKPMKVRTWCDAHYYRWKRYGDPMTMGPRGARGTIVKDPVERFWSKVRKTDTCWLWEGPRAHRGGYASMNLKGTRSGLVHRISYEWHRGEIPDGLVVDHLCQVTNCVRPDHLEAVTVQENSRRATRGRMLATCGQGHSMSGENVAKRSDGGRYCRECARYAQRARRARYRAEARARQWLEATSGVEDPRLNHARGLIRDLLSAALDPVS